MSERLGLPEIEKMLSEIARDENAGPDRFRALKMIASMNTSAVALDPPLTENEIVLRLSRLMKAAGVEACHKAFHDAYPRSNKTVSDAPRMFSADLPKELQIKAEKVTTLRKLNRTFPDLKRSGFWPGYPIRGSSAARLLWCQQTAAAIFLERLQRQIDHSAEEARNELNRPQEPEGENAQPGA